MSDQQMVFRPEWAFPVGEYEARLAALEADVAEAGFDALLIHVPENVLYISGFHTPGYCYPQWVIVAPGRKPMIVLRTLEALLLSQIIFAEGITKFALSGYDNLMKAIGLVTHRS